MAVAGIIRQQACGLGVWCPEAGGVGREGGGSVRACTHSREAAPPWACLPTAAARPSQSRPAGCLLKQAGPVSLLGSRLWGSGCAECAVWGTGP